MWSGWFSDNLQSFLMTFIRCVRGECNDRCSTADVGVGDGGFGVVVEGLLIAPMEETVWRGWGVVSEEENVKECEVIG
jgi:hypothetical protein